MIRVTISIDDAKAPGNSGMLSVINVKAKTTMMRRRMTAGMTCRAPHRA